MQPPATTGVPLLPRSHPTTTMPRGAIALRKKNEHLIHHSFASCCYRIAHVCIISAPRFLLLSDRPSIDADHCRNNKERFHPPCTSIIRNSTVCALPRRGAGSCPQQALAHSRLLPTAGSCPQQALARSALSPAARTCPRCAARTCPPHDHIPALPTRPVTASFYQF
jgi:hypothetical protein